MNADEIQAALDDVFDQALIFHAYTDYMRDYEVITFSVADPRTGITPAHDRFLFKFCVEADTTSAIPPHIWSRSLDQRLLDFEEGRELEGFVWGVRWQVLHPGAQVVRDSHRVDRWRDAIAIPFHEVLIETNAHRISLVFSDLEVTTVDVGYAPYVIAPEHAS